MPSFLDANTHTFFPNQIHSIAMVTATAYNVWPGTNLLTASGTIAALTVRMPSAPTTGEVVSLTANQTVTALTMNDAAGVAVAGAPTAMVANTAIRMMWSGAAWVRQL